MLEIVFKYRLQLAEADAIILHGDGKIQPDYSNDVKLYSIDFDEGKTIERIRLLDRRYHFEFLDLDDLLDSIQSSTTRKEDLDPVE